MVVTNVQAVTNRVLEWGTGWQALMGYAPNLPVNNFSVLAMMPMCSREGRETHRGRFFFWGGVVFREIIPLRCMRKVASSLANAPGSPAPRNDPQLVARAHGLRAKPASG